MPRTIGGAAVCVGLLGWWDPVGAQPMTFESECFASVCFAIGRGEITADTATDFIRFMGTADATFQVLLEGWGGSAQAGMDLGRVIRAYELATVVASSTDDMFDDGIGTQCVSACAMAFLGGVTRFVPDGNRIGFHQYALPENTRLPPSVARLLEEQGREAAGPNAMIEDSNRFAGDFVYYILEMGVDARLFVSASDYVGREFYYPPTNELEEFDVTTPTGFDHFRLEPFGNGVIAESRRLDATGYRDLATAIIALCDADGTPRLWMKAEEMHGILERMDFLSAGVSFPHSPIDDVPIEGARIRTYSTESGGNIEFLLDDELAAKLATATAFQMYFETSGASGGNYSGTVELNDMDRRMLDAAFRLCI